MRQKSRRGSLAGLALNISTDGHFRQAWLRALLTRTGTPHSLLVSLLQGHSAAAQGLVQQVRGKDTLMYGVMAKMSQGLALASLSKGGSERQGERRLRTRNQVSQTILFSSFDTASPLVLLDILTANSSFWKFSQTQEQSWRSGQALIPLKFPSSGGPMGLNRQTFAATS